MIYPRINITALLLVVLQFFCLAQGNEVAIQVNNRRITTDEFTSRFNSLPQLLKIPADELKENLICTLIAEAVLSFEAEKNKLDSLEKVKLLIDEFYDEALYEDWMNKEIRKNINVTEKELKTAYPCFIEKRHVEYWITGSFEDAEHLRQSLSIGVDSVPEPQEKIFEYSVALPAIEDVVYSLKENEISKPVKVDTVFYLFKLLNKEPVKEYTSYSYTDLKPAIEKRIRGRKENYLADEKLNSLMKEESFTINREAFNFLFQQIYPVIYNKSGLKYNAPEEIQQVLLSKEIPENTGFNQVLIEFSDNIKWTVQDAWKQISVSPYPLNYKNPQELQPGLFDVMKRIILLKSVAGNARAKAYDTSLYVKSQAAMWKNNILAQMFISKERTNITVDERSLIQFYDSVKTTYLKPELFKVVPLIVKTKKEAAELYDRVRQGEDFIKLAFKYSMNKSGADKNNPGIFITEAMWGEIGKAVGRMMPGDVSPVIMNTDSTYSIVKLLERKSAEPYKYEEIRDELYGVYSDKELQKKLNTFMSDVISNYKIKINREVLNKVKYLGGNMGVKKIHFPVRSSVPLFPLFDHSAKWYQGVANK